YRLVVGAHPTRFLELHVDDLSRRELYDVEDRLGVAGDVGRHDDVALDFRLNPADVLVDRFCLSCSGDLRHGNTLTLGLCPESRLLPRLTLAFLCEPLFLLLLLFCLALVCFALFRFLALLFLAFALCLFLFRLELDLGPARRGRLDPGCRLGRFGLRLGRFRLRLGRFRWWLRGLGLRLRWLRQRLWLRRGFCLRG